MKTKVKTTALANEHVGNFKAMELRRLICERAENMKLSHVKNRINLIMDLSSIKGLDLFGLLHAPEFDFAHDICGIMRHMDRSTYPGTLMHCFEPRYMVRNGQKVGAS